MKQIVFSTRAGKGGEKNQKNFPFYQTKQKVSGKRGGNTYTSKRGTLQPWLWKRLTPYRPHRGTWSHGGISASDIYPFVG